MTIFYYSFLPLTITTPVVFCGRPAYSDTAVIINTVRAGNWNPQEMGDGDEGVLINDKREYDVAFNYESPTKLKDQTIEKMESNEIDCETREGNAFTKCIFVREFGWNPAWPGVLHSKNDTHLTLFVTVIEHDGGNIYVSHAFQYPLLLLLLLLSLSFSLSLSLCPPPA